MIETYSFVRTPGPSEYKALIAFAVGRCSTFTLVERSECGMSDAAMEILRSLAPALVSESEVDEWPGTRLCGGLTATLRRYELRDFSAATLTQAPSLYAWIQPDRPEDLALWNDSRPLLVTIAHERDAYLSLSADERTALLAAVPTLREILTGQARS
jgi:hypothetical protein